MLSVSLGFLQTPARLAPPPEAGHGRSDGEAPVLSLPSHGEAPSKPTVKQWAPTSPPAALTDPASHAEPPRGTPASPPRASPLSPALLKSPARAPSSQQRRTSQSEALNSPKRSSQALPPSSPHREGPAFLVSAGPPALPSKKPGENPFLPARSPSPRVYGFGAPPLPHAVPRAQNHRVSPHPMRFGPGSGDFAVELPPPRLLEPKVRPSRAHPVSARANTGHGSARSVRWQCDMLPRRRLALTSARAGHGIGPELPAPLPCAAGPGAGTARELSCLRSAGVGPRLPRPAPACRTLYAERCVQSPIPAVAGAPAPPLSPPCSCGGLRACADRHSPLTRPPRLPRPRSCPRARLPRPPAGTATTPGASASTSRARPAAATPWPASPAAGRSSSSRTPPSPRRSGAAASPPPAPRRTPLASLRRANRGWRVSPIT